MIRILTAASAAILLVGAASAAPINFKPGNWSADLTMEAMGETMSESMTECMNAEEASMEPTDLAQEFAGGADCTASDVQQNGNTITFKMACPGEGLSEADITLTYEETNFTMFGDVILDAGGGTTFPATLQVDAKYLGACPN